MSITFPTDAESSLVHAPAPRTLTTGTAGPAGRVRGLQPVIESLNLTEAVRFSDAYTRWLRLVGHDSTAKIEQHPDSVLRELSTCNTNLTERPPVALFVNPSEQPRQSLAAGILLPHDLRLNSLGGLGFPWTLRGYRLVGNSLLGWRNIESQRAVLKAMLVWVQNHKADFLAVEDVEQQSSLWSLLESGKHGFRCYLSSPIRPRCRARFPIPGRDYWRKFSPKVHNSLRQKAKTLGRSRLIRVSEMDQVPEFIEHTQAVAQNPRPGQRRREVAVRDQRELQTCLLLAEQRWLRSYVLMIDGTPAGFVTGYQNRTGYQIRDVQCDGRFDKHSAEAILLYRVLEDLIKHDSPRVVDFGVGDAQFKRFFANESSRSANVMLIRQSRSLNSILEYLQTCRVVRTILRTIVEGLRDCDPLRYLQFDAGSGANAEDD